MQQVTNLNSEKKKTTDKDKKELSKQPKGHNLNQARSKWALRLQNLLKTQADNSTLGFRTYFINNAIVLTER